MYERAEKVLKPFLDAEDYMKDRVASGIEANRKGHGKIKVTDAEGKPVEQVHVELKQKTHDFRFGANCFMVDEMETAEKNAEYKRLFGELFNLATIPFYWSDLEPEQGKPRFAKDSPKVYRRPAPDLCVEFCREYGLEPKLHCLNYDMFTPEWVPEDVPTVKKYLDKRLAEIAERYRDVIPSMEVINETLCNKNTNHADGRHGTNFFEDPEIVEWSFAHARKYLPSTHLIINEATRHIWGPAFHWNRAAYYQQIERALAKGADIDAIGMQYHMFFRAEDEVKETALHYDPHTLYNVMDWYAKFDKPLQVTEITVPAYTWNAEDEDLQAEIIKNLYSIWFSHPAMEAAIYWNLVDGYAFKAEPGDMAFGENYYHGALVRFDMSPKPSYYMLKKLIHEEWQSNLSLSGKDAVSFKAFYGTYDAEVTAGGKTVTVPIHVEKGMRNEFTVKL